MNIRNSTYFFTIRPYIQLYFIYFSLKFVTEGLAIVCCIWEILGLSRISIAGYHE
jgi:hypothetical protein